MADQLPTEEELQRTIVKVVNAMRAKGPHASPDSYQGDTYFVSDWADANTSSEKTVAEVQEPLALFLMLRILGLEYVLADKHATAGLKKCLLENDRWVRLALAKYTSPKKPKGKPGPKPKDGKYKTDVAVELRGLGRTLRQIAKELYGDSKQGKRVSALISQAKKKRPKP
jgi:hypothetical protein